MIHSVHRARPLGFALSVLATASIGVVLPAAPAAAAPPLNPLECHSVLDGGWTTTATSESPVISCAITAPTAGRVVVMTTASLGLADQPYEARLRVDVDGADTLTDRWVDVSTDAGDGTDRNVAIAHLATVAPGDHTFSLEASRYSGTGTVQAYDPSIWALFIPEDSPYSTCAAPTQTTWSTAATSFETVASCTLDVTRASRVLVLGTAGATRQAADYEGRMRVGIDSTTGTAASDRWFNVHADGGDGTDRGVATQLTADVAPGSHQVNLLTTRYNGPGPVALQRPTLVALAVPVDSTGLQMCGSSTSSSWTNATTTYSTVATCDLVASRNGSALSVGTASAGLDTAAAGNDYEAQFRLGTSTSGSSTSDRWVNVVTDAGDGDDNAVAATFATNVTAGPTSFYFIGRRYGGSGTARLYAPGLAAIYVPAPDVLAPTITVTSAPVNGTSTTATASFTVDADATTTCALDGGAAQPCSGTFSASGLAVGTHTLTIVAVDSVGNESTKVLQWTVAKAPAPTPTPNPTPIPTPTTAPPPAAQPEVTLRGKKVSVSALLAKARVARACPAKARVEVRKGRTLLAAAKLSVRVDGAGCRVKGAVRLSPKPARTARIKVTISGPNLKTRTIRAVRA